jgi:probable HAF family extracellular repeat protein
MTKRRFPVTLVRAFAPIAFVLSLAPTVHAQGTVYRLVDLGPADAPLVYPTGISDNGQASGWLLPLPLPPRPAVLRTVNDRFLIPPGLENVEGYATAINRYGDLAGGMNIIGPFGLPALHAWRYSDASGLEDLGTLGGDQSVPGWINARGQVVGGSRIAYFSETFHAFLATPGESMRDLGTLGGRSSSAGGINDAGEVAGYAQTTDGLYHLFRYTPATGMQDLGAPSGPTLTARINDVGQIAGSASKPDFHLHAIRYTPGLGIVDLHPFTSGSSASDGINDRGDVVGSFGGTPETMRFGHAFIYTDGEGFVDLNTRVVAGPEGWILERAVAINNSGEIVGEARVPPVLELTRGFKLIPADVTPPVIAASTATPSVLWPPDGRLVPVQISVAVTDNTDPSPRCRVDRVSISDPDAEGDATVVSDLSLQLRAKRTGGSEAGRIYTIDIVCTDGSGNAAQSRVTVTVPHDSGGQ